MKGTATFVVAVLLLGTPSAHAGPCSSAIAQFEQALHLHPDFPEAEENLRLAKASDPQFPSQTPQ